MQNDPIRTGGSLSRRNRHIQVLVYLEIKVSYQSHSRLLIGWSKDWVFQMPEHERLRKAVRTVTVREPAAV